MSLCSAKKKYQMQGDRGDIGQKALTLSEKFRRIYQSPMSDRLTREQRHKCMAHIGARNTKPEIIVRQYLWAHGFRYRLNHPRLPGKPDIVLYSHRTCIFVNGCFWHGHEGCRFYVVPKSNTEFWQKKIERNKERDKEVRQKLASMGWISITLWECQLKPGIREKTLRSLTFTLSRIFIENHRVRQMVASG